ncbi:DUF6778 family protein [Abyssibius alkaniclasticus]|uniref:DUF6778 family protein n=1 Tax=Abyssibius alkaniclasticus TaxID=2881234 RepID=UPI0040580730
MSLKSFLIAVAAAATLGGCINTNVSYSEILREDQTFNWNVTQINVNVPRSLTTTDRNGQAPNVDIIWIEEGPGDTYLQVQRIFEEGVALGAGRLDASLKGGRSVRLEVEVAQFHTLTRRARSNIGGIHNVDFYIQAFDANTGEALSPRSFIESDQKASGGERARQEDAAGYTMRVAIVERIAGVVATWLAVAGDDAVLPSHRILIGR